MIFIILILIAVLIMLITTKPRKNLYWFRITLIVIIVGLIAILSFDYVQNFFNSPKI